MALLGPGVAPVNRVYVIHEPNTPRGRSIADELPRVLGSRAGQIRSGPEQPGKDIGPRDVLLLVLGVKEASRWTACDIFPPRNL